MRTRSEQLMMSLQFVVPDHVLLVLETMHHLNSSFLKADLHFALRARSWGITSWHNFTPPRTQGDEQTG